MSIRTVSNSSKPRSFPEITFSNSTYAVLDNENIKYKEEENSSSEMKIPRGREG